MWGPQAERTRTGLRADRHKSPLPFLEKTVLYFHCQVQICYKVEMCLNRKEILVLLV